ncbi:hypothetical protein IWQ61_009614 [Dispira simplex]|nr:hypothetical protein IWQ61_009614 [Dispira simplex]
MSLLKHTVSALERRFPLTLASTAWDNVGVLLEAPMARPQANKVLLTIDLTSTVLQEALADPHVGVIVAYHPPIFRGIKQLTLADPKQAILLQCAAEGISVYSPHTAWDNNGQGNADWLATCLDTPLSAVETILPVDNPSDDQPGAGTGRLVNLGEPRTLSQLVTSLKRHLELPHLRVAPSDCHWAVNTDRRPIRSVAICAGSGASVLTRAKADLFLTGEMSHHDVLAAVEDHTSVILCEHSNSERGFLKQVVQPLLEEAFRTQTLDYTVSCSRLDRDPLSCW